MCCHSTICSTRKAFAEHRKPALGLRLGGFVLKDIPVFDQNSVLDAKDVRRNPVHRPAHARESPMDDHEITIRHNHPRFILERGWSTFYEVEEAIATRLDMRAVLD